MSGESQEYWKKQVLLSTLKRHADINCHKALTYPTLFIRSSAIYIFHVSSSYTGDAYAGELSRGVAT